MLIGSLAREYHRSPYLNIKKDGNYDGLSIQNVINTINAFFDVDWAGHQCSPKRLMQPAIKKVKKQISTVSLADL